MPADQCSLHELCWCSTSCWLPLEMSDFLYQPLPKLSSFLFVLGRWWEPGISSGIQTFSPSAGNKQWDEDTRCGWMFILNVSKLTEPVAFGAFSCVLVSLPRWNRVRSDHLCLFTPLILNKYILLGHHRHDNHRYCQRKCFIFSKKNKRPFSSGLSQLHLIQCYYHNCCWVLLDACSVKAATDTLNHTNLEEDVVSLNTFRLLEAEEAALYFI